MTTNIHQVPHLAHFMTFFHFKSHITCGPKTTGQNLAPCLQSSALKQKHWCTCPETWQPHLYSIHGVTRLFPSWHHRGLVSITAYFNCLMCLDILSEKQNRQSSDFGWTLTMSEVFSETTENWNTAKLFCYYFHCCITENRRSVFKGPQPTIAYDVGLQHDIVDSRENMRAGKQLLGWESSLCPQPRQISGSNRASFNSGESSSPSEREKDRPKERQKDRAARSSSAVCDNWWFSVVNGWLN